MDLRLRRVLQVSCKLQETCVEWCKSLAGCGRLAASGASLLQGCRGLAASTASLLHGCERLASSGASPSQVAVDLRRVVQVPRTAARDLRRVVQVPRRLRETCVEWCKFLAGLHEVKLPLYTLHGMILYIRIYQKLMICGEW